ncbi:hypothetical protein [Streptomyces sp. NPDC057616]|uniref:hypothetical protein n=1 Tax=Streptomyces sp. NPDC057616 TaxID=3346183 RepID=UPI0036CCD068
MVCRRVMPCSGQTTCERAAHRLRIRIPSWASGARAILNGRALPDRPEPGSLLSLDRAWRTCDRIEVTLPMRTVVEATPDDPDVQAVLHGPVVLAGPRRPGEPLAAPPRRRLGRAAVAPPRFTARADGEDVTLLPVARVHHQHFSVYWLTGEPPPPPPEFAA